MSAKYFICKYCQQAELCFLGEEYRLPVVTDSCSHDFSPLPNNPTVVHSTVRMMSESLLDTWHDRRRLMRLLDLDAIRERETKAYLRHIINR